MKHSQYDIYYAGKYGFLSVLKTIPTLPNSRFALICDYFTFYFCTVQCRAF